MGCRVLGRGGKVGKTDSLWMAKSGQGGGLSAAVPTAHSVSVTGVREFNSQHANHSEQSTELFVSSPFISFPFPNNHPLLTLGFLAVFCVHVQGITQELHISVLQALFSADDTPLPCFSCSILGSI